MSAFASISANSTPSTAPPACSATGATRLSRQNTGTTARRRTPDSMAARQGRNMRPEQAEIPFWLLLIEVYQTQGNQEIFENLAVDYAVTYEVSLPSWENAGASQIAVKPMRRSDSRAGSRRQRYFPLRGVITDQSGEQLQKPHNTQPSTEQSTSTAAPLIASILSRLAIC